MKKVALMGLGLIFVSAAANAISFNGSAGQDYTHRALAWVPRPPVWR